MRIAIFDYQVKANNPIGGCHLRALRSLADEHDFVVFSVQFDNPRPDRIEWVRVPAPLRPLPLLFVAYHLLAPLCYLAHLLRRRKPFDLVQMVESKLSFGDVAYSHFGHTSYLAQFWKLSPGRGVRGFSRWLDHQLHALLEARTYRRVRQVLVPSRGLAGELQAEFPALRGKIQVLPNAVDIERLERPACFDRKAFRGQLGLGEDEVAFVFVALGHFERKGLPLLLDALAMLASKQAKLVVVGGTPDLTAVYRDRAERLGLEKRVFWGGMQADVRPYLWGADAFVLASTYETFSLVAFEAAAASLPLITTRLYGVEDFVRNGETGYVVDDRKPASFGEAMARFLKQSAADRQRMGEAARRAVLGYGETLFAERWREFYLEWERKYGGQGSLVHKFG